MRFHIGFSKRISLKTIIWLLGTIFLALVTYLGFNLTAYADTLSNKEPSSFQYFNNTSQSSPFSPTMTSNSYEYFWYITNPGSNSYNFTWTFNFTNLCSTNKAKLIGWFALDHNGYFYPNNSNFTTTYSSGGTLPNSLSVDGNWVMVTFDSVDLTRTIKVVMNSTRTESVTRALVSRNWVYTCLSDGTAEIIENNTQNTTNIINNQNSNTQSIINNQNSNTQSIIDSSLVCTQYDSISIKDDLHKLSSNGSLTSSDTDGVTDFISIQGATIEMLTDQSSRSKYSCFYTVNKTYISCVNTQSISSGTFLTIPNNAYYFRMTIHKGDNKPQVKICKNGNQSINDSLTDDSVTGATTTGSSFFDNFDLGDTHGVASIVTAPLRLFSTMVNNNESCSNYNFNISLGGNLNKNVSLPSGCILWDNVPSAVELLYFTIVYGLLGYYILIDLYHTYSSMKDPDKKNEYVIDL